MNLRAVFLPMKFFAWLGLFVSFLAISGCQTQQSKSLYGPAATAKVAPGDQNQNGTTSTAVALAAVDQDTASAQAASAIIDEDGNSYQRLPVDVPSPRLADRSLLRGSIVAIPENSPLLGPVRPSRVRVAQLTRKPNFFERAALRRKKYAGIVSKYARAAGVPVQLAMAIVEIESSFRPKAKGLAGEVGLMQLRPQTARGMGYKGSIGALYRPETNVRYGMKYLAEAHRRGGGKICGTILKYNAGHYAKRMNPVSARYCRRVKRVMARRGV